MNIVFCLDNNYVMPCGIAMTSLLENNKNRDITIFIIGMNLTEENKHMLQEIADQYQANIELFDIDKTFLEKYDLPLSGIAASQYITLASYIRLFISEILPSDIDKVLYLDCDLYVANQLDDLWNTSLDNYSVAGVLDLAMLTPLLGVYERIGYDTAFPYINAGILLINLKYWREYNVLQQFVLFINEKRDRIVSHDQDVINAVLHRSILLSPIKFNMQSCFYQRRVEIRFKNIERLAPFYSQLKDARREPCIVHFTYSTKPWAKGLFHPMVKEYRRYIKMTPWANVKICWRNRSFKFKFKYYKRRILYALKMKRSAFVKI